MFRISLNLDLKRLKEIQEIVQVKETLLMKCVEEENLENYPHPFQMDGLPYWNHVN
jgi:hypothetical protein